ncbi:glycoside hydrolase family protein [Massilia timonae]|uniref:glycoside hydrolase family protein n=1 Tax=Massilia timonae TaxID=47229 RepID=UPI0028D5AC50|nr:glycoside hydrolase family protein [Massilia timonae]
MDRQKLEAQLVIDEGRRAIAYVDTVGKMTAGVGRNITDRPFFDDEIALMLKNDIREVEKDLDRRLPWWRQMAPARQNVLANMCFNLGISRLLGFEQALTHMRACRYDDAAREMLDSRWAKQVGARAVRLAALMRKGEF